MSGATTHPPIVRVVGSASPTVLSQVAGRRRSGRVVHTGTSATYFDLDGTCLGLLSAHAVHVPCGIRTLFPRLPGTDVGAEVVVGDAAVQLPGWEVLVTDPVDPLVPVLAPDAAARGADLLAELLGERLEGTAALLPRRALEELAAGDPAAVPALLGLGPGLTPLGDDVLAGWLATAVAVGHPALQVLRGAVTSAAGQRTTVLAATLLACAARGEAVPELRALLGAVGAAEPSRVALHLRRLLDIGHDSGRGLALGVVLALPVASTRGGSP